MSQNKNRESGRKWDGKSRVSTTEYKKRYDEIFKRKTEELKEKKNA